MSKSEIYMARVSDTVTKDLTNVLHMKQGKLPFRYLGIPLSSKKLTHIQCKPLVDKIVQRMNHWTTKSLSYTTRVLLIKSILSSMFNFWAQVFLFPKKLIKKLESLCRNFLCLGSDEYTKVPPITWDFMCMPRSCGGLYIRRIEEWNKAALYKQLWAITLKKERLWVKWIHNYYYMKYGVDIKLPTAVSWKLKKK